MTLACSGCNEEIEECDNCAHVFEKGDIVICSDNGEHYCEESCLLESIGAIYSEAQAIEGKG